MITISVLKKTKLKLVEIMKYMDGAISLKLVEIIVLEVAFNGYFAFYSLFTMYFVIITDEVDES